MQSLPSSERDCFLFVSQEDVLTKFSIDTRYAELASGSLHTVSARVSWCTSSLSLFLIVQGGTCDYSG